MDEEAGFIAALAADSDDATTRLVYAGWLDDRDDPRAECQRLYVEMKARGWWIETEIETSRRRQLPPRPDVPLADVVFLSVGYNRWESEEWLRKIGRLWTLRSLHIEASDLNDDGLAKLSGLTELRALNLRRTRIADEGLVSLAELTNLTDLWLNSIPLTGSGLRHLKELVRLEELYLDNTDCTDEALQHMRPLRAMRRLTLDSTKVTDSGLDLLGNLPTLKYVDLTYSAVTDEAASRVKAWRPDLEIELHTD
jgi:uncharacterized protein (TIGR02996 family)